MSTDPHDTLRTDLTASVFAPHVSEAFTLWVGPEPVSLVLTGVEAAGADPEQSFTLQFQTSGPAHAPQGTYPVEHEAIGQMAIFLVPVRQDADGVTYEAVFNRSTRTDPA